MLRPFARSLTRELHLRTEYRSNQLNSLCFEIKTIKRGCERAEPFALCRFTLCSIMSGDSNETVGIAFNRNLNHVINTCKRPAK